jgi:hypothetical protein
MKLPPQMKSGRRLVAVNEERTVGLYGSVSDGYRVLCDGAIGLGEYGERPYPRCPDGKWFWRKGEKPSTEKHRRANSRRAKDVAFREAMTQSAATKNASRPISASQLCIDCGRYVGDDDHSHTIGLPARAICCPCARAEKRGFTCFLWEAERRAPRRANEASQERRDGSKRPSGASRRGRRGSGP